MLLKYLNKLSVPIDKTKVNNNQYPQAMEQGRTDSWLILIPRSCSRSSTFHRDSVNDLETPLDVKTPYPHQVRFCLVVPAN